MMPDKEQLIELANRRMPFGKYQGRRLIYLKSIYCGSRVKRLSLKAI